MTVLTRVSVMTQISNGIGIMTLRTVYVTMPEKTDHFAQISDMDILVPHCSALFTLHKTMHHPGGKATWFIAVKPRRHGSTRFHLTYRQFTSLNRNRGILAWCVV